MEVFVDYSKILEFLFGRNWEDIGWFWVKKKKKSEGNVLDCFDFGCCVKNIFKRVEVRRLVGK